MPSPHKGRWSHCFEVARQIDGLCLPRLPARTTSPNVVQAGRRHDTTVADPETVWLTPTPYLAAGCGDTTGGSDLDVNAKLKPTESERSQIQHLDHRKRRLGRRHLDVGDTASRRDGGVEVDVGA